MFNVVLEHFFCTRMGEMKRKEDPYFYCSKSVEKILNDLSIWNSGEKVNVWIVTDARRKTDLDFFFKFYTNVSKTVRIVADESTRSNRNWNFVEGIDNCETECDLDTFDNWSFIIYNNNDHEMEQCLNDLISFVEKIKK